MSEINEMIIAYNAPDDPEPEDDDGSDFRAETEEQENRVPAITRKRR